MTLVDIVAAGFAIATVLAGAVGVLFVAAVLVDQIRDLVGFLRPAPGHARGELHVVARELPDELPPPASLVSDLEGRRA